MWTFGGSDKVARIEYAESDPHVTGLAMPMRWVLPGEPNPDSEDADAEAGAA